MTAKASYMYTCTMAQGPKLLTYMTDPLKFKYIKENIFTVTDNSSA